jgi:E3 ubiquitin-protein ligase RAD18
MCSARVTLRTINVHLDNGCRDPPPLTAPGIEKQKKSNEQVKGEWNKIMGGGGGVVKGRTKAKGKEKERYVPSPKSISLVLPRAKLLFCNFKKTNSDPTDSHPLPKASYAVLKDRQLKDMLIEYNLPTNGERSAWIARHRR